MWIRKKNPLRKKERKMLSLSEEKKVKKERKMENHFMLIMRIQLQFR